MFARLFRLKRRPSLSLRVSSLRCQKYCVLSVAAMSSSSTSAGSDSSTPKFTNRLINAQSPYLLEHAHNPVDWWEWGPEAIANAREKDQPIFLSVGYSTCHWCHVMEKQSFENEEIAKMMNETMTCIKVDREERPDLDRLYMSYVTALSGHGGWPMSVWLTPELTPIFGATYFPPASFASIWDQLCDKWSDRSERTKIEKQGQYIMSVLERHSGLVTGDELKSEEVTSDSFALSMTASELNTQAGSYLAGVYQHLRGNYDGRRGGFGGAPKFPRPVEMAAMLRCAHRWLNQADKSSDTDSILRTDGESALTMSTITLRSMSCGGMFDQIGGGYHRYSVDSVWHVPHYEKMSYDNSQLLLVLTQTIQMLNDRKRKGKPIGIGQFDVPFCEHYIRFTLDYILKDMTISDPSLPMVSVSGQSPMAFYSAEDADSVMPMTHPDYGQSDEGTSKASKKSHSHGLGDKREGAFYTWTETELSSVLSEKEFALFTQHFHIEPDGNCGKLDSRSDPHGELAGVNTPIIKHGIGLVTFDKDVMKSGLDLNSQLVLQSAKDSGIEIEIGGSLSESTNMEEIQSILDSAIEKVKRRRDATRKRPNCDDKSIVSWNALMITALCQVYKTVSLSSDQISEGESAMSALLLSMSDDSSLIDQSYLNAAVNCVEFLKHNLYCADSSISAASSSETDTVVSKPRRLRRCFREGKPSTVHGFASDYAQLVGALLHVYEACAIGKGKDLTEFALKCLQWALELQDQMDELFWNPKEEIGGYFESETGDELLLFRGMEDQDGAEPCSNSVSLLNLSKLYSLTGDEKYLLKGKKIAGLMHERLLKIPQALPLGAVGIDSLSRAGRKVVIIDNNDSEEESSSSDMSPSVLDYARVYFARYCSNDSPLIVINPRSIDTLSEMNPSLKGLLKSAESSASATAKTSGVSAFVCTDTECFPQVTSIAEFQKQLDFL